ncbi:hypothetical protein ABZP36_028092 [Zizania latifolia]
MGSTGPDGWPAPTSPTASSSASPPPPTRLREQGGREAKEVAYGMFLQKTKKNGILAASEWLFIVPWGLQKLLNYVANRYGNPVIYVTENGMDEEEDQSATLDQVLNDTTRVGYFKGYLASVIFGQL